jgi:kynurenine 3-monooxygenase
MAHPARHVVIVGAGLAGSLLACYLADRGWSVDVFERRPDPRARGYAGGRSINLALSIRGITGLRGAGLDRHVLDNDAIRMPGRMLHHPDGHTSFQPYSADPADAINSVSRGGLNLSLISAAAQRQHVRLHFDQRCVDADLAAPSATFAGPDAQHRRIDADLVVATDGAFSAVRLAMLTKTDRFDYSQTYLKHGYKELSIPAATSSAQPAAPGAGSLPRSLFRMEPHALHIWPRGGAMMIALPNRDGSFTCTLFWPFSGEHGFDRLESPGAAPDPRAVEDFFRRHYPDAVPLMPTLAADFARNPTSSLVTVRCWPWQHAGKVCLLGDAAHAIVPFYGQGMNAAFEDCLVLARCLDTHAGDQRSALEQYQDARKPNADAIADMALENFIEMRDLAGREDFQYRKKIEQTLHRALGAKHADRVTPQYNLVSFSTVPYALAQNRGREMDGVLREIARTVPANSIADPGQWEAAVLGTAEPLITRLTPIPAEAALTA